MVSAPGVFRTSDRGFLQTLFLVLFTAVFSVSRQDLILLFDYSV